MFSLYAFPSCLILKHKQYKHFSVYLRKFDNVLKVRKSDKAVSQINT